MIWGLAIGPGQMYSCVLDEEVHLSLAALDSRPDHDDVGSKYSQVVLKTKDTEQLLCTLVHGTIFQQSLDLKLMPREKVSFSVQGSGVVYITGYSFSSPDGDYIEDEEMPSARRAVEQEARSRVEQEEIITAGVSVNIKDEPHDSIQEDSFQVQESTPGSRTEPSTQPGNNRIDVSAPMDEEETTHPVATISEKESDFLEKAGTSSSGWQDSRIPLYGTEEAGVYPQASNSQRTGTNLDDSHEQPIFHQVTHGHEEVPKTSSSSVYTRNYHVVNTRDQFSDLPQVSAHHKISNQDQNCPNRKKAAICRYCRATFSCHELKRTHEATHTDYKAYQCLYCIKSFKSHGHREQHERIHTGVKPYKCRICSKGFTQSGDRNRHERIHTVRKTFQCKCCTKSFRSFKYLIVHERSKHGLIGSNDSRDLVNVSSNDSRDLVNENDGQPLMPR
ncbi:uncharacterized protein [Apostichopus japonicus]|uniref:uncharacterized protein isoform X4 n=1 Tax=Stichopus japonicus TaxID=307972 RepID=UPI003AB57275